MPREIYLGATLGASHVILFKIVNTEQIVTATVR